MDAFFASVEMVDRPEWRGHPLLVGYDGARGVVAAASYEARKFGCHSAQPMVVAKRLCPQAIVSPVRFERYREVSKQVFEILGSYTPLVEPLSIDEAFLDVTGSEALFGPAAQIARELKARVFQRTQCVASVGVAPNKFLAKLASDLKKPDALVVIESADVARVLNPLPIGKIWGIGPKTAAKLEGVGIRTIGDLLRLDPAILERQVGQEASHYRRLAMGLDDRPVIPDSEARSIGQEQTFGQDVPDPQAIRDVMLEQTEQVAARLRRRKLMAAAVRVKIRFGDFQTITRSRALPAPTDSTQPLWVIARELFDAWAERSFQPVRLIGVTAANLTRGDGQLDLFADPVTERQRRLDAALDHINGRYGNGAVRRGRGD